MRKTAGNVLEITRLCFFNEGMLEKHNVWRGGEGVSAGEMHSRTTLCQPTVWKLSVTQRGSVVSQVVFSLVDHFCVVIVLAV